MLSFLLLSLKFHCIKTFKRNFSVKPFNIATLNGFLIKSRFQSVTIVNDHMSDNCRNDNNAADNRPVARTFAEEKENPDRIEQRFDKADKIGIERANSF